jgi:hypothetical protein
METFDKSDIIVYRDMFSIEDCWKIIEYITRPKWAFGHGSYNNGVGVPFWAMNLSDEQFFSNYLLNIIEQKTNSKYDLERVYANGHTYGTQGVPHQDGIDKKSRTFLFYANDNWSIDWSGKTVFLLNENEQHYELPTPNKGILFPGRIYHYAEQTTRKFTGLRVTIAWKLYLKE